MFVLCVYVPVTYLCLPVPTNLFQHTEKTFHDIDGSVTHRDSQIFLNTFDYLELKPISDVTPAFRDAKECDCQGLYCAEPFYFAVRNHLR